MKFGLYSARIWPGFGQDSGSIRAVFGQDLGRIFARDTTRRESDVFSLVMVRRMATEKSCTKCARVEPTLVQSNSWSTILPKMKPLGAPPLPERGVSPVEQCG